MSTQDWKNFSLKVDQDTDLIDFNDSVTMSQPNHIPLSLTPISVASSSSQHYLYDSHASGTPVINLKLSDILGDEFNNLDLSKFQTDTKERSESDNYKTVMEYIDRCNQKHTDLMSSVASTRLAIQSSMFSSLYY